jgi:membrane-bound lytic murein transglycosylase D
MAMRMSGRWAVCAAATVMLAGCAGNAPKKTATASSPAAPGDAVAQLYSRLDADTQRYANGLELARGGETERAQSEMKAALDDLRNAATRCLQTHGCDVQRFVAGFDSLLRSGVGARSDQVAEGDTSVETPEANAQAGEAEPLLAKFPSSAAASRSSRTTSCR